MMTNVKTLLCLLGMIFWKMKRFNYGTRNTKIDFKHCTKHYGYTLLCAVKFTDYDRNI